MKFKIHNLSAMLSVSAVMLSPALVHAQNLLTNEDFSGGNQGFSSGYSYVSSGVSATINTFGIRTNSQDFNPGYVLFGDHTTGNGNMMLVDGSSTANTIVWSETVSVTTNTQYAFSCWATSSDSENVPTLRFSIDGVQVGADLTLPTDSGNWHQFLVVWNSGANTSATLSVVDTNLIALGNDFALDDFSFSPATPALNIARTGNQSVLFWPASSGTNYILQSTTNLASPNWVTASDAVPAIAFTVTNTASARFFRLQPQQ